MLWIKQHPLYFVLYIYKTFFGSGLLQIYTLSDISWTWNLIFDMKIQAKFLRAKRKRLFVAGYYKLLCYYGQKGILRTIFQIFLLVAFVGCNVLYVLIDVILLMTYYFDIVFLQFCTLSVIYVALP